MPWDNPKNTKAGGFDTHVGDSGWNNPATRAGRGGPVVGDHHGHGGILGAIGHVLAKTGTGLADIAYHAPGGLVHLGKDLEQSIVRGEGSPWHRAGDRRSPIFDDAHAMATATRKSLTDPHYMAEHPEQTLLNLLPLGHGLGSVAARGAAGVDAARAGEGVGAAARAFAEKPPVKPRLFKVGDKTIGLHPSRNPAMRAGQEVHDIVARKALADNPGGRVAGYVTRRLGGSLAETRRYQDEMRAAPAQLLAASGKPLDAVEQAALRLTAEQALPEESIALHQRQLEAGVNPEEQQRQIDLLSQVRDRGIVGHDEQAPKGQKVFINPEYVAAKHGLVAHATHGLLGKKGDVAGVDEQLAAGGAARDKILEDTGQMPAEGLQARIDMPNRFRAGAEYVEPTPGRLGKPEFRSVNTPEGKRMVAVQSLLEREQGKLDTLHKAHAEALDKEDKFLSEQRNRDLGPLSLPDAHARLAELDKLHEEMLTNIGKAVNPYSAEQAAAETRGRNTMRGRMDAGKKPGTGRAIEGRVGGGSATIKTVKQEIRDLAEQKLHETIQANPEHPIAQRAAALVSERDRLRAALTAHTEHQMGIGESDVTPGMPSAPAYAHASVPRGSNIHRNEIVRLGHLIEDQTKRVTKIRNAVDARIEPTGVVGGEDARAGRQYVPYYSSETRSGGPAATPRANTPVIGKVRKLVSKNKPLTGEAQLNAHVPDNTTGIVARQMQRAYHFLASDTFRRDIATAGHDGQRQSPREVLVNTQELEHAQVPDELRAQMGQKRWTLDELQGHAHAYEAWRHLVVPGLKDKFAGEASLAEAPKGYRWVDRNLLAELGKPGMAPNGNIMRTIDTVNAAQTAATVYFKLGHVATRAGTNAVANLIQGSLNPVAMSHAYRLWEKLTPLERVRAMAAAGEGGIHALPAEGMNTVSQVARGGALWWSKHFDAPSRFLSLAYEARKAGYGSVGKFRELLDHAEDPASHGLDAAQTAKVDWIMKRANREPISYNRLNEFERRYVRRAVWFYPWIKGASQFAVNTMLEHPYKSAVIGEAGRVGTQDQGNELGALPSYERALFKVGGSTDLPLVENVGTVSPFETPGEVLETLTHLNKPTESERLSAYLTPALSAAARVAFNLDEHGRPVESKYGQPAKTHGTLSNLLSGFGDSTPELALYKALTAKPGDQAGKMFPNDARLGWLRFFLGSVVPRPLNKPVANEAAYRDRAGAGR